MKAYRTIMPKDLNGWRWQEYQQLMLNLGVADAVDAKKDQPLHIREHILALNLQSNTELFSDLVRLLFVRKWWWSFYAFGVWVKWVLSWIPFLLSGFNKSEKPFRFGVAENCVSVSEVAEALVPFRHALQVAFEYANANRKQRKQFSPTKSVKDERNFIRSEITGLYNLAVEKGLATVHSVRNAKYPFILRFTQSSADELPFYELLYLSNESAHSAFLTEQSYAT